MTFFKSPHPFYSENGKITHFLQEKLQYFLQNIKKSEVFIFNLNLMFFNVVANGNNRLCNFLIYFAHFFCCKKKFKPITTLTFLTVVFSRYRTRITKCCKIFANYEKPFKNGCHYT